jgi:hypothetical protein
MKVDDRRLQPHGDHGSGESRQPFGKQASQIGGPHPRPAGIEGRDKQVVAEPMDELRDRLVVGVDACQAVSLSILDGGERAPFMHDQQVVIRPFDKLAAEIAAGKQPLRQSRYRQQHHTRRQHTSGEACIPDQSKSKTLAHRFSPFRCDLSSFSSDAGSSVSCGIHYRKIRKLFDIGCFATVY